MSKMAIVLQRIGFRPPRVGETPVTYMTRLGLEIEDAKRENPGYPGPIHPSVNSWTNAYARLAETFSVLEIPTDPDPLLLHRLVREWAGEVRNAVEEVINDGQKNTPLRS
jgi:hypothetical protein